MIRARLIVCEQQTHWTVALRWALVGGSISVRSEPDSEACWRLLDCSPGSVLVLELRHELLARLGARLLEFNDQFPWARLIVAGEFEDASALWLARELGAVQALTSIRNLTPTIRLIRRHFEQLPDLERSYRDQVWDQMPWGAFSEGATCVGIPTSPR